MNTEKNIEEIIDLMRRDDSVDAPESSVRWAKNLFLARAAQPKASPIRKLIAVLQMDMLPNKAVFGERSGAPSAVRQMLFSAGEAAIDLRITRSAELLEISGQILGDGFEGAAVKLYDPNISIESTASEQGEFKLEKIPVGVYTLIAESGDAAIVLENIDLG
jgi:hypothetical protein